MSQENVEIVRRAWDAFNDGDAIKAFEVFAADVEWDVSQDIWGGVVGGGHYWGIEGVTRWLADLYGPWETFEMEVEELLDVGDDRVIGVLCARGRGRASGVEVEHHPASVTTLDSGKVVRVVWHATREAALEAVGLSE